jgi:hypothetical protein
MPAAGRIPLQGFTRPHIRLRCSLMVNLKAIFAVAAVLFSTTPSSRDAPLPKTPPASWSDRGWLGFRFGMGPGDVYARLRDLGSEVQLTRPWFPGNVDPGMSHDFIAGDTTYRWLDMPITAAFTFAEGRLVAMSLFPAVSRMATAEQAEMGKLLDEEVEWSGRVKGAFSREWGEPLEIEEHHVGWKRNGTRIRVGSLGHVSIQDAVAYDRAESAGKARISRVKADVEAGRLTSTNRATWGAAAWNQMRWGMGPGDVSRKIEPSKLRYPEDTLTHFNDEFSLEADVEEPVYGRYVKAAFRFRGGRLVSVLLFLQHPQTVSAEDRRSWSADLEKGLRRKYGATGCTISRRGRDCRWYGAKGNDIILSDTLDPDVGPGLYYSQPQHDAVRGASEEREKL